MNPFQVLIDTNAYVAFKRGHPPAVEILQYAQTIAINSIVLGELLKTRYRSFNIDNRFHNWYDYTAN